MFYHGWYTHSMEHPVERKQKKHPWPLLLLSIIFFGIAGYWVTNFPPSFSMLVGIVTFPLLLPFFIILFSGIFTVTTYFTLSWIQGLIVAVSITSYLLLRLFGITHILFGFLLLAMVVSLEFALLKKK